MWHRFEWDPTFRIVGDFIAPSLSPVIWALSLCILHKVMSRTLVLNHSSASTIIWTTTVVPFEPHTVPMHYAYVALIVLVRQLSGTLFLGLELIMSAADNRPPQQCSIVGVWAVLAYCSWHKLYWHAAHPCPRRAFTQVRISSEWGEDGFFQNYLLGYTHFIWYLQTLQIVTSSRQG